MPRVTFLLPDGTGETIEASAGASLMRAAVTNGIEGIEAECGGALACGTCHVQVERGLETFPPPTAAEDDMLDALTGERTPLGRLSCQLILTGEHDDLVVRVPPAQG